MPGNWPVPFGKGPSEKDPHHGNLVGGLLHSRRRGLETEQTWPRSLGWHNRPGNRRPRKPQALPPASHRASPRPYSEIDSGSRAFFGPGGDIRADTRTNRTARKWAWSPSRRGLTTRSTSAGRLHVIAYRATADVPRELAWFTARLLLAERRRRGTPKGSRALACFWQAVLGRGGSATAPPLMRWPVTMASRGPPPTGAWRRSSRCSPPRPGSAPGAGTGQGRGPFPRDPGREDHPCRQVPGEDRQVRGDLIDVWYSRKAHAHGGNIQAVIAADGFPL